MSDPVVKSIIVNLGSNNPFKSVIISYDNGAEEEFFYDRKSRKFEALTGEKSYSQEELYEKLSALTKSGDITVTGIYRDKKISSASDLRLLSEDASKTSSLVLRSEVSNNLLWGADRVLREEVVFANLGLSTVGYNYGNIRNGDKVGINFGAISSVDKENGSLNHDPISTFDIKKDLHHQDGTHINLSLSGLYVNPEKNLFNPELRYYPKISQGSSYVFAGIVESQNVSAKQQYIGVGDEKIKLSLGLTHYNDNLRFIGNAILAARMTGSYNFEPEAAGKSGALQLKDGRFFATYETGLGKYYDKTSGFDEDGMPYHKNDFVRLGYEQNYKFREFKFSSQVILNSENILENLQLAMSKEILKDVKLSAMAGLTHVIKEDKLMPTFGVGLKYNIALER